MLFFYVKTIYYICIIKEGIMKVYTITYELSKEGTFLATIPDVPVIVLDFSDLLPEVRRRYPMFDVNITTYNLTTTI